MPAPSKFTVPSVTFFISVFGAYLFPFTSQTFAEALVFCCSCCPVTSSYAIISTAFDELKVTVPLYTTP
jgi:hypothetical protein